MDDEIFGPILPILTVNSHDEAIQLILSRYAIRNYATLRKVFVFSGGYVHDFCRPKPLALYVFSKTESVVQKFLDRTSSGGVCVNDTIWHCASKCMQDWTQQVNFGSHSLMEMVDLIILNSGWAAIWWGREQWDGTLPW